MTTSNAEPRSHLEREVERLRTEVERARAENKRLSENLDFQRRRHETERETMRHLLEETEAMRDTLTYAQARGTELLETLREPSIIDEQVREFHAVCGDIDPTTPTVPIDRIVRLRLRLVLEEAFELLAASCSRDDSVQSTVESLWSETRYAIDALEMDPDLEAVADALGDLDYVSAGTRLAYGIPRKAVADEIHRANMAKAPDGVVSRTEHGKIIKPEGWTPPNHRKALGLE
jgi:predicted HAD superfamily Cof-like phosphohydrolase